MRIRQIKPEFWKHEGLGELPREARFLFIGLSQLADCAGRMKDNPRLICSELFPYDDDINPEQVDAWLEDLAIHREAFIIRYEVNGYRYIQVSNFKKHQHLMGNEAKASSKYPEPFGNQEVKNSTYSSLPESLPSKTDIRSYGYTEERIYGVDGSTESVTPGPATFFEIIRPDGQYSEKEWIRLQFLEDLRRQRKPHDRTASLESILSFNQNLLGVYRRWLKIPIARRMAVFVLVILDKTSLDNQLTYALRVAENENPTDEQKKQLSGYLKKAESLVKEGKLEVKLDV